MSLRVKAQHRLATNEDFINVFMLEDGSTYGVAKNGRVEPFCRSYTGHVVKEELKALNTTYDGLRRDAKVVERNLPKEAMQIRNLAEKDVKPRRDHANAFWTKFKTFKPTVKMVNAIEPEPTPEKLKAVKSNKSKTRSKRNN